MDQGYNGPHEPQEFDLQDGLALALSYLEDPSDVPCPHCGPGTIEVVCFLDAPSVETGNAIPTEPEGDYTVVLYCHHCGRAAALDLTRDHQESAGDSIDELDADALSEELGDGLDDASGGAIGDDLGQGFGDGPGDELDDDFEFDDDLADELTERLREELEQRFGDGAELGDAGGDELDADAGGDSGADAAGEDGDGPDEGSSESESEDDRGLDSAA